MKQLNPKVNSPPSRKKVLILLLALVGFLLLLGAVFMLWGEQIIALFQDPQRTRELITDAGPWGPAVFLLLQIGQVLLAPIPGQATGLVAGFLFGTFWGTAYGLIGLAIGSAIIFILARKLGRPFVERFVDKKTLSKFDYLADNQGVLVLFLIFLVPALPDDLICFVAGLTRIKISTLIIITVLGRLPGMLALSFVGSGVATADVQGVIIVVALSSAALALGYWQRARVERFIKRLAKKEDRPKG